MSLHQWISDTVRHGRFEHSRLSRVGSAGRSLIISYIMLNIAEPLLGIFSHAYLWQRSNGLSLIVVYDSSSFLGLVAGFYVGAFLVGRYNVEFVYISGCSSMGFSILALTLIGDTNIVVLAILGMCFGLSSTLFWASRRFLVISHVAPTHRFYFTHCEGIVGVVLAVIVPPVIGWCVVVSRAFFPLYTVYVVIGLLAFTVLGAAGYSVRRLRTPFSR